MRLDDKSLDQMTNFFEYYDVKSLEVGKNKPNKGFQIRNDADEVEEALTKTTEEVRKLQREHDQCTNFRGFSRQVLETLTA